MDYTKNNNLGVVTEYDKYVGTIIAKDGEYMFIDTNTVGEIKQGDIVRFRGEKVDDKMIAFFVENVYNKEKKEETREKEEYKKYFLQRDEKKN